jgi:hypothetical protein
VVRTNISGSGCAAIGKKMRLLFEEKIGNKLINREVNLNQNSINTFFGVFCAFFVN